MDNSNRKLDNRFCEGLPRESHETECNRIPCPEWVYSHWSECSRSCGGGLRIRHASCQNGAGKEVSSHLCIKSEKLGREKCNEHLCTMWKYSNFKSYLNILSYMEYMLGYMWNWFGKTRSQMRRSFRSIS